MTDAEDVEIGFSALVLGARNATARAIREAVDRAGFEDLPPRGPGVVAMLAFAPTGMAPLQALTTWLGLSKQASGALVDLLVLRGYVERTIDPEDRRRLLVTLTERGAAAAETVIAAGARIDGAAATAAGDSTALAAARRVLIALAHYRDGDDEGSAAP